jgi:GNAT superfamily N-acetyltransferase
VTVAVRPVRVDECERAGQLVVAAYEALPGDHLSPSYRLELADVARRAAQAEVLVAADDGPLLGCVTFVSGPSSPWAEMLANDESGVRMLAVDPVSQGRGVGQALLTACIEAATALGRDGLFLHTTPWMTQAHRLYLRSGFVRTPGRDWTPVADVRLLAFRLDLTAAGTGRT